MLVRVNISEVQCHSVWVEAPSVDKAREYVEQRYYSNGIMLEGDCTTEFEAHHDPNYEDTPDYTLLEST